VRIIHIRKNLSGVKLNSIIFIINPNKGFHIDFIYSNFSQIDSVEIGLFENWV
jgi:hypothetical protein